MKMTEIIEKVRKLLDMEADQKGLPEGELAGAIARQIMLKYGISKLNVSDGKEQEQADDGQWLVHRQYSIGKPSMWRRLLVHTICDHLECKMVYFKHSPMVQVFGFEKSVQAVSDLYDLIEPQLVAKGVDYKKRLAKKYKGEQLKKKVDAFLRNAVEALEDRFARQRKGESKDTQALVLYTRSQVEQFFCQHKPSTTTTEVEEPTFHRGGYAAGWGVTIDLPKGHIR